MEDLRRKMGLMLFDYETTYRTDYRFEEKTAPVKYEYKAKKKHTPLRDKPLKDLHTLSDWKSTGSPFGLLHEPKEIVRTNPRDVQKCYTRPEDLERLEAQRTRPRLVMTPAVSMDDITNARARELLVEDIYTSDMAKGQKEATVPSFSVRAPFPGRPAPANPIFLPKLQAPYVSPEWRMDSVTWDAKQLRSYCDPTKEFWLAYPPFSCRACDESAIVQDHRKMMCSMRAQK